MLCLRMIETIAKSSNTTCIAALDGRCKTCPIESKSKVTLHFVTCSLFHCADKIAIGICCIKLLQNFEHDSDFLMLSLSPLSELLQVLKIF